MIPEVNLLKIKKYVSKKILQLQLECGNLNKFEMVHRSSETSKPGPVQFLPSYKVTSISSG